MAHRFFDLQDQYPLDPKVSSTRKVGSFFTRSSWVKQGYNNRVYLRVEQILDAFPKVVLKVVLELSCLPTVSLVGSAGTGHTISVLNARSPSLLPAPKWFFESY